MRTARLRNRPSPSVTAILLAIVALAVLAAANWVAVPTEEAEAYSTVWVQQFGSSSLDGASGLAFDHSGLYVGGTTQGAIDGQTSAGGFSDAFIRKYDHDGEELWTRQFGTGSQDQAGAIAVEASGVYVAGWTVGTFAGQTSAGGPDAFVRKYDHDGEELWTRQFGTSGFDVAAAIAVHGSGMYVAGYTGTGAALPGQTSEGGSDAFVRKYDHDGGELWTRQFGTSTDDNAHGVSVDGSGVYVAGVVGIRAALPGQTSEGGSDAFVRKYDHDGEELLTRQFGTTANEFVHGMSVHDSGIYVVGYTDGSFAGQRFDRGRNAFVRKYSLDGEDLWTRQFGTSNSDAAWDISVENSGVYIGGNTDGRFGGQTSQGSSDAFARKYDHDGEALWTRQFGTSGPDFATGISVGGSGVYVAGRVDGSLPGQTSAGGPDAFIMRLTIDPAFCGTLPATFVGTEGDDVIWGTPGRDVIQGLGGNDVIHGLAGDDVICGGDGDDTLNGGWGSDIVKGEEGDDWVAGGWGDSATDVVSGGRGDDRVFGGDGDDFLWGGGGQDQLYGGEGDDLLQGNHRWDLLRGGIGNDVLYGDQQNPSPANPDPAGDRLLGEEGDDQLFGQLGDDDLDGGADTDTCDGGPGTDTVMNCE